MRVNIGIEIRYERQDVFEKKGWTHVEWDRDIRRNRSGDTYV